MKNHYAIILCGGSGSRLWPISRSLKPKQLLPLNGLDTLLQQTANRICQHIDPSRLFTVTHDLHQFEVKGQLAERYPTSLANVISEPTSRNTLPATAIAVKQIYEINPKAIIGVFASDHAIDDEVAFLTAWKVAEQAAEEGFFTLLGIKPDAPITGYGYIKPGSILPFKLNDINSMKVDSFVEKPTLDLAKQYVASGYLWNSGMFVFRADVFMNLLERFQPSIFSDLTAISGQPNLEEYEKLPSLSIDYGIAEKAENIAVVPVDMKWSDLGSWESVYRRQSKEINNNVTKGNVVLIDTKDSLVWADTGVVSALGVDNLVVVKTADVTMICNKDRTEDVKLLVTEIQKRYPTMAETHLRVNRPWGSFTVLEEGPYFKIKSIIVNPYSKLSLQRHQHRSEHWIVVQGVANVINGDESIQVNTNESTYIPAGTIHRLENNTENPLVIIEVQTGLMLTESDIERFEDAYGRPI